MNLNFLTANMAKLPGKFDNVVSPLEVNCVPKPVIADTITDVVEVDVQQDIGFEGQLCLLTLVKMIAGSRQIVFERRILQLEDPHIMIKVVRLIFLFHRS